jgi:hypothetical protein
VSSIDLHVVFFLIGLALLIVEVVLGMVLGVALSGAITFFILGLLTWMGLIGGLDNYLIVGVIVFVIATTVVLKYFRNRVRSSEAVRDVNDY